MELGDDYTPGLSQYKEGKVMGVEGEEVTLELVRVKKRVGGKFQLEEEEQEDQVVQVRLQEMVQPLVIGQV